MVCDTSYQSRGVDDTVQPFRFILLWLVTCEMAKAAWL